LGLLEERINFSCREAFEVRILCRGGHRYREYLIVGHAIHNSRAAAGVEDPGLIGAVVRDKRVLSGRDLVLGEQVLEFIEIWEFQEFGGQFDDHVLVVGVEVNTIVIVSDTNGKRMIIATLKAIHVRRRAGGSADNSSRSSSPLGVLCGLAGVGDSASLADSFDEVGAMGFDHV
jgi:hypothetical protein